MAYLNKSIAAICLCLLLSVSAPAVSAQGMTPAEDAGVRILAIAERGYLRFSRQQSFVFVEVENRFWGAMTHQQKEQLCNMAGLFFREQGGGEIRTVIFQDMTSGGRLAHAEVFTKRIEVSIAK